MLPSALESGAGATLAKGWWLGVRRSDEPAVAVCCECSCVMCVVCTRVWVGHHLWTETHTFLLAGALAPVEAGLEVLAVCASAGIATCTAPCEHILVVIAGVGVWWL